MKRILNIVNHRDSVLVMALVFGLIMGERTRPLADISMWSLAFVMVFSTTGFTFRSWIPVSNMLRPLAISLFLNYVVFGLTIIGLSWIFFHESYFPFFAGLVLIAAAPPGPSVIPFSTLIDGDTSFSVTGVFGLHLLAMLLTPLILLIILGQALINPVEIFWIMARLILIPLVISRLLRHPRILPGVEKVRNTAVKWGFFLVVSPIVGMSVPVLQSEPLFVLKISGLIFFAMFVMGSLYHYLMVIMRKGRGFIISSTLMMVIKSSAFAAVAAFRFFPDDPRVALPSAVVSVFVTLFIIFYSMLVRLSGLKK